MAMAPPGPFTGSPSGIHLPVGSARASRPPTTTGLRGAGRTGSGPTRRPRYGPIPGTRQSPDHRRAGRPRDALTARRTARGLPRYCVLPPRRAPGSRRCHRPTKRPSGVLRTHRHWRRTREAPDSPKRFRRGRADDVNAQLSRRAGAADPATACGNAAGQRVHTSAGVSQDPPGNVAGDGASTGTLIQAQGSSGAL